MSWWDPRTWFHRFGPAPLSTAGPGGWLRDAKGDPLQWGKPYRPITVYVDSFAEGAGWWNDTARAMSWINGIVGAKVFDLEPLEPIKAILAAYAEGVGAGPPGSILVTTGTNLEPTHGFTDVRQDERNGAVRNAIVSLPTQRMGDWSEELVRHEMLHALGLGHGGGLMAPVLAPRTPALLQCDLARLREAYGG
jgi:hypothetical protein